MTYACLVHETVIQLYMKLQVNAVFFMYVKLMH